MPDLTIPLDEGLADEQSRRRVAAVLRREQYARDGRQIAACWALLADRIERDFFQREDS